MDAERWAELRRCFEDALQQDPAQRDAWLLRACPDPALQAVLGVVPFQLLAHDLAAARGAAIDTARYPQLYPVFVSKSIHK